GSTPSPRSSSSLARRAARSSTAAPSRSLTSTLSLVPFEDDAQAVQGEPRFEILHRPRVRDDQFSEPTGRDHAAVTQFAFEPVAEPVDLRRDPVHRARLDRLDRRLPDDVLGRDQFNATQSGSAAEQRVERDLDAGENGTAEVLAFSTDRLDRGGGAEVDDD